MSSTKTLKKRSRPSRVVQTKRGGSKKKELWEEKVEEEKRGEGEAVSPN